jgi:hypothetical protein
MTEVLQSTTYERKIHTGLPGRIPQHIPYEQPKGVQEEYAGSSEYPMDHGLLGDAMETESVLSFNGGSYHDDRSVISDMNLNNHAGKKSTGYNGKTLSKTYGAYSTSNAFHGGTHTIGSDKGHYCTTRWVKGRRVPVEFYMNRHNVGSLIRNALSGIKETNLRMGRIDEDAFFKVKLANGEFGQDCPGNLFYNSPEEYERHFYTTVSQSVKDKWMARNLEYQRLCDRQRHYDDTDGEEVIMIH